MAKINRIRSSTRLHEVGIAGQLYNGEFISGVCTHRPVTPLKLI